MAVPANEVALEAPGDLAAGRNAQGAASSAIDRALLALLAAAARRFVINISGLEHIGTAHDPFIVAVNHSTQAEAVLVPTLLIAHRGGKLIHFLADWNYRLIPGIGLIYRRAQTICVMRKPARPRILNLLKPFYAPTAGPLRRAGELLRAGSSVGVFPEGKINADPRRLLPGFRGAAFLSMTTRAPVVPVGIRFPNSDPSVAIADFSPMELRIGAPLRPPRAALTRASLLTWHGALMREIGILSGKAWTETSSATAGDRP